MQLLIQLAFVVVVIITVNVAANVDTESDKLVKCCENEFVLSEDMENCESSHFDNITYHRILQASGLTFDSKRDGYLTCFKGISSSSYIGNTTNVSSFTTSCLDLLTNNSIIYLNCSTIIKNNKNDKCDSVFKLVNIYGAPMLITANMIYIVIYLLVCLIYAFKPKICRRAYDKAVLMYTTSQILISVFVIYAGYNFLCHKTLSYGTYSVIGIMLMIFTISTCFWLLIISFDVASTITRISWAPSSGAKKSDENHKFKVYLLWVIIGTIIPVGISTILELSPLPEDHILKPQFWRMESINYRVVIHVATVPILIAIASNTLFIYTSLKMISIRKSAKFANENRRIKIKKRYFLYVKLYLFMDAPYVTGALGSIFENLWILKFSRLIQPVLMLIAVLPREMTVNIIPCRKKNTNKECCDKPMINNVSRRQ